MKKQIVKFTLGVVALGGLFSMGFYADNQIGEPTWNYTLESVPNTNDEVWVVENTAYSLNSNDPADIELNVKTSNGTQTVYVPRSVADYYKAYPKKLSQSEYANDDYGYVFVQNDVPSSQGVQVGQSVAYDTQSGTYTYPDSPATSENTSSQSQSGSAFDNTTDSTGSDSASNASDASGTSTSTTSTGQPSETAIEAAENSLGSGYQYVPYNQAPSYVQAQITSPSTQMIFQVLNPGYPASMVQEYQQMGWTLPNQYIIVSSQLGN